MHGNFRGLEFFIGAILGMTLEEEATFLGTLAQAEVEIQTDMALETIIQHRSAAERALLQRLPTYQTPVPIEGIVKIALDMEAAERLLQALLAVSLVERRYADDLRTEEYQCSPLVAEWLRKQGSPPPDQALLKTAAEYQRYLFRNERKTLGQAVMVHKAMLGANRQADADRFALNWIIGELSLSGIYQTLLEEWLPAICRFDDPQTHSEALGQTGKQFFHLGIYDTALDYLKQSLAIQQEIGDTAGLCATLFNMGHIHVQNEDVPEAIQAWLAVYRLAKSMNLAHVLDALEQLAGHLGLPGGLDGWEALSRKIEEQK